MLETAVITGAAQGIGFETAKLFASNNINLFLIDKNKKKLNKTVSELKKEFKIKIKSTVIDVSKEKEVIKAAKKARKEFGKIDYLINNAAIAYFRLFTETTTKDFEQTMNVNVKGVYLMTKHFLSLMKEATIVNISSGAGKHGIYGLSAYCASKFAVIGLTESLAKELPKNIKAYSLCPGGVNTEMHEKLFPNYDKRLLLKPREVAEKILWVCKQDKLESGAAIDIRKQK